MTDAMRDNLLDALHQLSDASQHLLSELRKNGSAWIVGGWVRDSLIGIRADDMDIATTLTPEQVKSIFPRSIMVGASFGTVIVRLEDDELGSEWQVTTLRSEGDYSDGRRPDRVSYIKEGEDNADITEDLGRRDFTINSMAVDIKGNLIDPHDGLEDLARGILRTVGSAERRFGEDGLRVLRAFRFLNAGETGIRDMDNALEIGIIQAGDFLSGVSRERVGVEISKILSGKNAREIAVKMDDMGVLDRVFKGHEIDIPPELSDNYLVNLALFFRNQDFSSVSLSELMRELLVLSKNELAEISMLHDNRKSKLDSSIESLRIFRAVIPEIRRNLILDYMEKSGVELLSIRNTLKEIEEEDLMISPLISGDRLVELTGLSPGPRLGKLKGWLHRNQIERGLKTEGEVMSLLQDFDWAESNYEDWKILRWP
tara:strand:+ start:15629 stop:16912 length:1284 start_codon:yes stop_codon:yes gene_type:complete